MTLPCHDRDQAEFGDADRLLIAFVMRDRDQRARCVIRCDGCAWKVIERPAGRPMGNDCVSSTTESFDAGVRWLDDGAA